MKIILTFVAPWFACLKRLRRKSSLVGNACSVLLLLGPMTTAARSQAQQPDVTIVDVPAVTALAAGDLNGDGRLDLAIVEALPRKEPPRTPLFRLHLLFQKNGTFSLPADKTIDLGETACSGLAIGDFDADGRNDLAVGLRAARTLSLFFGAEHFGKEHRSRYTNDSSAGGLSVGRVNKTGLADFFTGAAWRQWQGNDRFGEAYFAGPKRNDNWCSTLADMDRDGTDDVIFTTHWTGKLTVPENNLIRIHYGPFLKMQILQPTDAAGVVTLNTPFTHVNSPVLGQVLAGDLNDDDQLDLVVPATDQTLIYLQNSPTGFSDNANPTQIVKDATPLLVADLDGDKLCDVAFLPKDLSGIALWRQQKEKQLASNLLAQCQRIVVPRMTSLAAAADLNGDGRKEILVALNAGGLAIIPVPRRE